MILRIDGWIDTGGACRIQLEDDTWADVMWTKGYLVENDGRFVLDDEIAGWIGQRLRDGDEINRLVSEMRGCFAFVAVSAGAQTVTCVADRFATIPIFAHVSGNSLFLSDNVVQLAAMSGQRSLNRQAIPDFLRYGYVLGQETLVAGIDEVHQGAVTTFRYDAEGWSVTVVPYWRYDHEPVSGKAESQWEEELTSLLWSVARLYASAIEDRDWQAAITLSGGFDSRLLLALFKEALPQHLKQVISYGHPASEDISIARSVAKVAGVAHRVVEIMGAGSITTQMIWESVRDIGGTTRFDCGIGLRHLGKGQLDVYIPGHGLHNLDDSPERGKLVVRNKSEAIQMIYDNRALLDETSISRLTPALWSAEAWRASIDRNLLFTHHNPIVSIDRWNLEQSQRRLFLHDVSAYSQCGFWLLPLLDNALVDFFCQVPLHLRYKKRLLLRVLTEKILVGPLGELASLPASEGRGKNWGEPSPKERLLMSHLPRVMAWPVFWWGHRTKARLRNRAYTFSEVPSGPDPIAYWWRTDNDFKDRVIEEFKAWDGAEGAVDVSALTDLLLEPSVPYNLVQFGIPSLLTLKYLSDCIVESR